MAKTSASVAKIILVAESAHALPCLCPPSSAGGGFSEGKAGRGRIGSDRRKHFSVCMQTLDAVLQLQPCRLRVHAKPRAPLARERGTRPETCAHARPGGSKGDSVRSRRFATGDPEVVEGRVVDNQ